MTYPANFLFRTIDRLFLMKLKRVGDISDETASYYLYRIWADFAQGVTVTGIARRYIGWSDEEYDAYVSHGGVKPCDLFAVVEDFVGWCGASDAMIGEALDAGFLAIKRDDVGGVYLECVGFDELNKPKKLMQSRGGLMKGVNNAKRKGLARAEEFENFLVATDAGKSEDANHGLSAEAAVSARSLIFQINKVLGNERELGLGDLTAELVVAANELMRECGGEEGVPKLLEWVYTHKDEIVGKDRMDLVIKRLLEVRV